jgi:signal transduction histidine kinase
MGLRSRYQAFVQISRFSAVVSALIVALLLCVLFALAWRALDRFESATAQVMKQGSQHVAEQVANRIQRDFKSPAFNLLERVDHNAVRELDLAQIEATLERDKPTERLLDQFFVWSNAAPAHPNGAMYFFRLADDAAQKAPAAFVQDDVLARAILDHSARFAAIHANFALTRIAVRGRTFDVVYHLLYNLPEREQLLSILGFTIDSGWLRREYFGNLVQSAEVAGLQLSGFPLLISIIDDENREAYRSGRSLLGQYEDEVRFPYLFYDVDIVESLAPFKPDIRYWRVRTAYRDGDIHAIARRETNRQRLTWALVALIAGAAILLTVRAAMREVRIAEMKSDFVASVSHELKTPLAKIQLFSDSLTSGRIRSPEKIQEYALIISAQATKLSQQIAGLLDFRKIEAGVRQYDMADVDLRGVLRTALTSFEPELYQHGFDVRVELPEEEVPVVGNSESLQRLFENLISNAIKYSDVHRALSISLARVNGHVEVAVGDHGIGIPAREQMKIFRKFYRGSQPRSKPVSGSGLGLSIAHHIVKAHGGRIGVTSVPGEGSTFRVVLPADDEWSRERLS